VDCIYNTVFYYTILFELFSPMSTLCIPFPKPPQIAFAKRSKKSLQTAFVLVDRHNHIVPQIFVQDAHLVLARKQSIKMNTKNIKCDEKKKDAFPKWNIDLLNSADSR
jgi:hypothetical protein